MKDEFRRKTITEFAKSRLKAHSYLTNDNNNESKKAKNSKK